MNNQQFAQFAGQQYLNLESFRQNGEAVRTPLWFAEENGILFIYTLAAAWKVKRIRRNPQVRIAPCDIRGNVKGAWMDAEARILDAAEAAHGQELLRQKYGWKKKLSEFVNRFRKNRQLTVIAIRPR